MKVYNGNKIIELPKVIKQTTGIKYTSKMTESQLNEAGFYYIEYRSRPNRKYYTSVESSSLVDNKWVIDYIATPVDVDNLKIKLIQEIKSIQKDKLSSIDWYWLREQKIGTPVPQEIQDMATNIYDIAATKEAEVQALSTIEEYINYEKEPYEYTLTEEDIAEDSSYTVGDVVTRYKNNITEWGL